MILKEFPDIHWLKNAITNNFSDQKSWDNRSLPNTGWPTVILQTKTKEAERKDIKGPFSLFLNKTGSSEVKVDGRSVKINGDALITTNAGQHYDLLINELVLSETFNIHFGEKFYQDAVSVLSQSNDTLLQDPESRTSNINLKIKTSFRDQRFNQLISMLELVYDTDEKEHVLFEILAHVLTQNANEIKQIKSTDYVKKSTCEELVSRVYLAVDYIHSNFSQSIELEQLAAVAMLSKFHFLRVFKSTFNTTPHQYIKNIRLQKAIELIRHTDLPLYLVAQAVGIDNGSSLSRMIYQRTGSRPTQIV